MRFRVAVCDLGSERDGLKVQVGCMLSREMFFLDIGWVLPPPSGSL